MAVKKKKRWFAIKAPKILHNKELGETYVMEPEKSIGKTLKANLMSITNEYKHQNINLKFRIVSLKENSYQTQIIRYEFIPSALKRIVRRRQNRLDESFACKTADDKMIRVKPIMITLNKTKSSVQLVLRSRLKSQIVNTIKKFGYDKVFDMVITHRFQRELKEKLSKVYPVRHVEIRVLELETRRKVKAEEADTIEEESKEQIGQESEVVEEQPEKMVDDKKPEDDVNEESEKVIEKKPAEKPEATSKKEKKPKVVKEEPAKEKKAEKKVVKKAPKAKKVKEPVEAKEEDAASSD